MGKQKSLRSKAVHFVSDLTTVFLNPISDKPSKPPPPHGEANGSARTQLDSINEEEPEDLTDGPDTTSFTAFLYSLLSAESGHKFDPDDQDDSKTESSSTSLSSTMREISGKKNFLSKGKQSLKALYQAAKFSGFRNQERKSDVEVKLEDPNSNFDGLEMRQMQNVKEDPLAMTKILPETSEPSLLLSEKTRSSLYSLLPAVVQDRKWLLLYSTWRHGISLSTLYRRSMIWPGPSLLVVGDDKSVVFGGLVEAPLRPTNKKYQGTNSTFVFTNKSGEPIIFRPTGANRYYTLCSPDYLAIGGGGHFALYLDSELLSGSSSVSETYGNPCLAHCEDFTVKEVELWGFVYGSKYDDILSLSRTEAPGICRW